jgi:hypothetical protein
MSALVEVLCATARKDIEVQEKMGQILVTSDTNAAVDNLLEVRRRQKARTGACSPRTREKH